MHLLAATQAPRDESVAIDLGQSPGDIVLLSSADSDLACFAAARARLPADFPSLRLANLLRLGHPMSVDLYADSVLHQARLVIVRLLGGLSYWRYGIERLLGLGVPCMLLPGDDRPDPELACLATADAQLSAAFACYFRAGGIDNAEQALRRAGNLVRGAEIWPASPPAPLRRAGCWCDDPETGGPRALLLFYRALLAAGDVAPIAALSEALRARGFAVQAAYIAGLKDEESAALLAGLIAAKPPDVIVSFTGFAAGTIGGSGESLLSAAGCPILQAVPAASDRASWRAGSRGLGPRDLAMHVALPEIDGRMLGGIVSFKETAAPDPLTEALIARHAPEPQRIVHIADLAAGWADLRRTPAPERRIALMLANYPNRDGRIGNGVGLDTPASAIAILRALAEAGYRLQDMPADGAALMRALLAGPTNALAGRAARRSAVTWPVEDYRRCLAALPAELQDAISARWGEPEQDPHVVGGSFALSALRLGNVLVMIQPSRGYHIDPASSYHAPDLVPPHFYLASYFWLRRQFAAHAIVHIGKHGTLEWLPGKSVGLSELCYPEAVLGAMPELYPFIVNDPGEGTQAKRRSGALIIDHLTPPLTRAENYGALAELERLVDEYYQAAMLDPRRLKPLAAAILDRARATGLAADCGMEASDPEAAFRKLDAFLCDLKERQIRDGLHVFGSSPETERRVDLLVALARLPRGRGEGAQASLLRALADDLALGFDPLGCDMAEAWAGPRPDVLQQVSEDVWRTCGDTVERLELLARSLVSPPHPALSPRRGGEGSLLDSLSPLSGGEGRGEGGHRRTEQVLQWINDSLAPSLDICGAAEIDNLLRGLDGKFVPPGPSGAPSRGRPDVLPTGRNFYSVDTRAVPTPTSWALGWQSAQLLVERYAQDHGTYPKRLVLSAWGTAAMRTGGDDIAQAMALMGVRPTWEGEGGRVTGFEILPAGLLDRPRVDVTLRVSGFFRDAFPGLIDLFDRAARAIAALEEPPETNPLADSVAEEAARLEAQGLAPAAARRRAAARVFGSKPGSYGAGLQALIDEGGWRDTDDLARAYLAWSSYAYVSDGDGGIAEGSAAHEDFAGRIGRVEAVVHNQDNHEHDLLDSDDYYQFEGGLAAAIRHLQGETRPIYHNDHSRPERPRIMRLEEELARVVRARAANPKWLAGAMRHGYKGAAEMAATVDYLFAFAATTGLVADHHFDLIYDSYLRDPAIDSFLAEANPAARAEIAARLEEALRRGLWQPRENSVAAELAWRMQA